LNGTRTRRTPCGRYLTRYDRWNSPKFLFGESYGTARSCVVAYMLHEDGVDLNGVTLLSSILDYSQAGNPVGLLPTLCADAWYHKKITVTPPPADLPSLLNAVVPFAQNDYAKALAAFPDADPVTVQTRTVSDRPAVQRILALHLASRTKS
jgi:carboxypeptidase C (cathepsin A)